MSNATDPGTALETATPETAGAAAPASRTEQQRRLFRWFFFAAFALLIYQLLLVLSLFADIIIWAASLTLVCFPIHAFIDRRIPRRHNVAAAASTLVVLLMVLVPLLSLLSIVIEQSVHLYPTIRDWVRGLHAGGEGGIAHLLPDTLRSYWTRASEYVAASSFLAQFDLEEMLLARVDSASAQMANFGARMVRNILLGVLNLLLVLVLMFFCFRDGKRFLEWLFETLPMPAVHAESIALRIYQTVTAVIRGALLTAAAQGLLASIGYGIAGVQLAVFFGVLTGVAAMIPVFGTTLVWLPIGLFMIGHSPGWGVFVLLWGLFVSVVDNFLKPVLIGTHARMPILLIFFGVIGGINVYGLTGVMLGPILMACVLAFATIYREDYAPEARARASEAAVR